MSCSVLAYQAWIHNRKGKVNKELKLLQDHVKLQLELEFLEKEKKILTFCQL